MATHSPKDQADEVFIFLLASFLGQFGVELFISDISFAASRLVQGLPALVRTAARDQAVERKSCPEPSIPKLSKLSQLSLRKPTMQDPYFGTCKRSLLSARRCRHGSGVGWQGTWRRRVPTSPSRLREQCELKQLREDAMSRCRDVQIPERSSIRSTGGGTARTFRV